MNEQRGAQLPHDLLRRKGEVNGEQLIGKAIIEQATTLQLTGDDGKPVLVIASLTPSDKAKIEGFPASISQIAIELYQPLPGGIAVGGSFAPREMEVPHMKRYDAGGKEPAKVEDAK